MGGTLFDSELGICNHAYLVNCQQSSFSSTSATWMPTTSTTGAIIPSVGSTTSPETSSASSLSPGDSTTSLSWNENEDAGNKPGISGEKPVTVVNIPTDNIIVTRPTTDLDNNTSESNDNNSDSSNNNINGENNSGQCGSVFDCGSGFNNNGGGGDNNNDNNNNDLLPTEISDGTETEESSSSNTDHNSPGATDIGSGGFDNNDSDNSGNPDDNNDNTDNDEGADNIESDFSVSSSSLYPCSEPGYFNEASSCAQFFVCKEVAPGVLSADRIHRCPPRYLFDPVTRLCQREAKVTCDQSGDSSLFYSGLELLVVKLTESELDTFFSQELTLPRRSPVQRQGVQYRYPQLYPHLRGPLYP